MFEGVQHIGYLVHDLDQAVAWFQTAFAADVTGGGAMADGPVVPGGGRNAFVRFGRVEAELMQPADNRPVPAGTLVMHHVGYVVADIARCVPKLKAKGLTFLADQPFTNVMGQRVLYLDPRSTHGAMMHLTEVPPRPSVRSNGSAPAIDAIVHAGYLVRDADAAAAWYVDAFDGVLAGSGPSRRGGKTAFVDCGAAQIELIQPPDPAAADDGHLLDHVGYVTKSLTADMAAMKQRGLAFATPEPLVNPIGQTLIYLDTGSSMGTRMHLTVLAAGTGTGQ